MHHVPRIGWLGILTLNLTVLGEPAILRQPANQSVSVGASAAFSATAAGTGALTWQWLKDGVVLPGAIANRLEVKNVQLADSGQYQLRVTDTTGGQALSEPALLVVDPAFTKITTGRIVEDQEVSGGCAWGDYDGDGHLDLFVTNLEGRNALYHNEGDGSFTRITGPPIATDPATVAHGCAWIDFDNDGQLDLSVANINHPNLLYRNLGQGRFERLTADSAGSILSDSDRSIGLAWADFDRDGWVDLFVPNGGLSTPQNDRLYRNRGDGRFEPVAGGPVVEGVFTSNQGAWADFDNDGDPDLFVTHHGNQRNGLYRNNGGTFELMADSPVTAERNPSIGAAWGDYDNDGWPDLFVTAWDGALNLRNSLFRNLGGGAFEQIQQGAPATDAGKSLGCAWVDYDNDGWLDLFVATDRQRRAFYRNQGDGQFTRLTEGSLVNDQRDTSVGCAWADFNNDGFPDLFIANGGLNGPARNALYRNNGNGNSWIKLRCTGTLSNRSAVGAKIRVRARIRGKEQWQLREIVSGSGYISHPGLQQGVGLGDAAVVDLLRIEWPSGVVQEFHNLAVRQTLDVVEPVTLKPALKIAGTAVELMVNGETSRSVLVEGSSDLATWHPVGKVVPSARLLRVADAESGTGSSRFYRARVP